MITLAISVTIHAKAGNEHEVEQLLECGRILSEQEPGTISWYAYKIDSSTYGIFDTFKSELARQAHLAGPIARSLMESAAELFEGAPDIRMLDLIAAK
jgi:quinol monooxygenase YgiN